MDNLFDSDCIYIYIYFNSIQFNSESKYPRLKSAQYRMNRAFNIYILLKITKYLDKSSLHSVSRFFRNDHQANDYSY